MTAGGSAVDSRRLAAKGRSTGTRAGHAHMQDTHSGPEAARAHEMCAASCGWQDGLAGLHQPGAALHPAEETTMLQLSRVVSPTDTSAMGDCGMDLPDCSTRVQQ